MAKGKLIVLEGVPEYEKNESIKHILNKIFEKTQKNYCSIFGEVPFLENYSEKKSDILGALAHVRFFKQNREEYSKGILSKLEEGETVLSNRYWHSEFVFKGEESLEKIIERNKYLPTPDLTIVFEYPKQRINSNYLREIDEKYKNLEFLLPEKLRDKDLKYLPVGNKDEVNSRIDLFLEKLF